MESAAVDHHQQQEQHELQQHELQHQDGDHEIDQKPQIHHQDQQQHGEEIETEQTIAIKSEDTSSQDGDQHGGAEADSGEWQ